MTEHNLGLGICLAICLILAFPLTGLMGKGQFRDTTMKERE